MNFMNELSQIRLIKFILESQFLFMSTDTMTINNSIHMDMSIRHGLKNHKTISIRFS